MNNKKFNSKEELDNYLLSNKTPFSVIDQKIDYSLVSKKKRKVDVNLWKKITIGFASLCLVLTCVFGVLDLFSFNKKGECPFELGTYTFSSQEGSIEGLDFSESSYIVLSDEELSGPGTFIIEDEDNEWVVYGKFYECGLEEISFGNAEKKSNSYLLTNSLYRMEISYAKHSSNYAIEIYLLNENAKKIEVKYICE